MNTKQQLLSMIPYFSVWTSVDGGFERELLRTPERGASDEVGDKGLPKAMMTGNKKFVSLEELAAIHPKIALGIELISARKPATGVTIHKMLEVWNAPVHVVTVDKKQVALYAIENIHILSGRVRVESKGINYEAVTHQETGETFMLSGVNVSTPYVDISTTWMDESYPGWKTRFDLAQSLNLSLDQVMQSACSKQPNEQQLTNTDGFLM